MSGLELSKEEIYAVVAALVAVIVTLWSLILAFNRSNAKRLEKYEAKQDEYQQTVINLSSEVARLQGNMQGVTELSRSVLDKIEEVSRRNGNSPHS
jgi:peptidoglycan hydrolase CwlO-like protein